MKSQLKELTPYNGLTMAMVFIFHEFAQAGSLAKAARGDEGRAAYFSRMLREIDAVLEGPSLTIREGRNIVLSEAGRSFASFVAAFVEGLSQQRNMVGKHPFRLAAAQETIRGVVIPSLRPLAQAAPGTELIVESSSDEEAIAKVLSRANEYALIYRRKKLPAELHAVSVMEVSFGLLADREANTHQGKQLVHLRQHAPAADRLLQHGGLEISLRSEVPNFEDLLCAAAQPDTLALVPRMPGLSSLCPKHQLLVPDTLRTHKTELQLVWLTRMQKVRTRCGQFVESLMQSIHAIDR